MTEVYFLILRIRSAPLGMHFLDTFCQFAQDLLLQLAVFA